MITPQGYSKDPNLVPEAIVITWSKDVMIQNSGSIKQFITDFKSYCNCEVEEGYWIHNLLRQPTRNVFYVYIIFNGRIRYRTQYCGWNPAGYIIQTGPVITAPRGLNYPGFRNFRYATKLF